MKQLWGKMSHSRQNKNNYPAKQNTQIPQNPKGQVTIAASHFSGPIPPPDLLRKYEEINPGFADRIMRQAEAQTAHRIEIEKKVISSDIIKSYLGIIFAFIIGVIGTGGGLYLASIGLISQGLVMSGGSIATIIGAFIYGTASRRRERQRKA